jgi:hypothetical protein
VASQGKSSNDLLEFFLQKVLEEKNKESLFLQNQLETLKADYLEVSKTSTQTSSLV